MMVHEKTTNDDGETKFDERRQTLMKDNKHPHWKNKLTEGNTIVVRTTFNYNVEGI